MVSAKWNKNQDLADAQAGATTYDSSTTDYDSITVYYDGYDPTGLTPEGEVGAVWEEVAE
jgi:hypothetical protein